MRPFPVFFFALIIGGCASLPETLQRAPSRAFQNDGNTLLGRSLQPLLTLHPGRSGFQVLNIGKEAYSRRIALLDSATSSIDAQYYIWNADTAGRLTAARILNAANRGVRVRVLLDDFGIGDRDKQLLAINSHPKIEVRIYNPFNPGQRSGIGRWLGFLFNFDRLNRRMHNKTFTVDGSVAIVGGRNIGDEYFDMDPELNFLDRELLAVGPVVEEVSESFDAYWNSQWAYPIDVVAKQTLTADVVAEWLDNLTQTSQADKLTGPGGEDGMGRPEEWLATLKKELIWAEATLVYDVPAIHKETAEADAGDFVADTLLKIASASETSILIESAYFIPGKRGLKLMAELKERGVEVRALTNSLASTDLPTVHAGYANTRREMLERGVELSEFRVDASVCAKPNGYTSKAQNPGKCSLHAKTMVFDGKIVFVGSFNLNPRSVFLNSETALIVYSPELAQRIGLDILEDMRPDNAWRITHNDHGVLAWTTLEKHQEKRVFHEPDTSLWQRTKSAFLSLLPFEKYW